MRVLIAILFINKYSQILHKFLSHRCHISYGQFHFHIGLILYEDPIAMSDLVIKLYHIFFSIGHFNELGIGTKLQAVINNSTP